MSHKILIISPSWIGDCVMTQPLFRRLRELNPNCTIDVFAPKWSQAVFERMPEVNEILDNPFGHGALRLRERWNIGRMLGQRGYDQVIVLPGSLKAGLIAWATGIKKRTGYVGESRYLLLNDIRQLDKNVLPLMVDRYTALAHDSQAAFNGQSSQPSFTIQAASQQAALEKHQLNRDKPIVAFCLNILWQLHNIMYKKDIKFGYLGRKKILILQKILCNCQIICVLICVARPVWQKRLIYCR